MNHKRLTPNTDKPTNDEGHDVQKTGNKVNKLALTSPGDYHYSIKHRHSNVFPCIQVHLSVNNVCFVLITALITAEHLYTWKYGTQHAFRLAALVITRESYTIMKDNLDEIDFERRNHHTRTVHNHGADFVLHQHMNIII